MGKVSTVLFQKPACGRFMGLCPKPYSLVQYFASQSHLRWVGHLPHYLLKKTSQKLLFACGAKTIVFANWVEGVTPSWEFEGETLKEKNKNPEGIFLRDYFYLV